MADVSIYSNIAKRTGGDVYIGVVGPVRAGKSTFIKKFMESVVLPAIPSDFDRERARDELPQSAGGKTVMTTEPKFVPDEGAFIKLPDGTSLKVKLVDCVGYMIPEALGVEENGEGRMVHTPWHTDPVPFAEAAEYGTRKVISEHSTIGMLITSDGTTGDFPRDNYVGAEERVAAELKELDKPFAVILNSTHPENDFAVQLATKLEEKYSAPVALVNMMELNAEDIWHILGMVLEEFPAKEADIMLPQWTTVLPEEHKLRRAVRDSVMAAVPRMKKLRDVKGSFADELRRGLESAVAAVGEYKDKVEVKVAGIDAGEGSALLEVKLPEGLYFDVISEITGIPMANQAQLLGAIESLSAAKQEFDKYKTAITEVNERGYGVVTPDCASLTLKEPEIVRHSGGYGVKIKATAPSIHMIKTTVETEINPIVGTEQQSEEMVKYLTEGIAADPEAVWSFNMFGRSLYELVSDGLNAKLANMPEDARAKFGETLGRIINEGSQGLICIIL